MRIDELYLTDAYLKSFEAQVVDVDPHGQRLLLNRTAFYPGGGGQPHDRGELTWTDGKAQVVKVARDGSLIWHWVEGEVLPDPNAEVAGQLDWQRRAALMRTHTALHILCGVIWQDFKVAVTGGNMEPGKGRLDFELDSVSTELGRHVERRMNEEIARARDVVVNFLDRVEADRDPALIRTKANLIPAAIDPIRIIDIVGLDKQADGGTHVGSTLEVGRVAVIKTESKGRANKRIRIAIHPT